MICVSIIKNYDLSQVYNMIYVHIYINIERERERERHSIFEHCICIELSNVWFWIVPV